MGGIFNWKNGMHFERKENGDVRMYLEDSVSHEQTDMHLFPAAEWCSIFSAMCAEGPCLATTHNAVLKLHTG